MLIIYKFVGISMLGVRTLKLYTVKVESHSCILETDSVERVIPIGTMKTMPENFMQNHEVLQKLTLEMGVPGNSNLDEMCDELL